MPDFNPTNFPYVKSKDTDADVAVGGRCIEIATAGALKLGELVVLSAASTVNKSNTAADDVKRVGIVVGGDLTGMRAVSDKAAYGVQVVTSAGGKALVQVDGLTYTIADAAIAATGALTLGTTTAGRVKAAVIGTTGAGAILGLNLEIAAGAGSIMLTLLR